jgi:chemotaxis protein methyltransferase CheR
MTKDTPQTAHPGKPDSALLRGCLEAYLTQSRRIWNHLPDIVRLRSPGRKYGRHLHALVRLRADRKQYFSTFFLRNRSELQLIRRLVDQKGQGCSVNMAVLACSKGAEVYSILWAIRSGRPDLKVRTHAVDISQDIVDFAQCGVYSRIPEVHRPKEEGVENEDVTWNTCRDQNEPIFQRMTSEEMDEMFDVEGDQARIKPWLKEGINWLQGDAGDPELVGRLGTQDLVVANRFLCHMAPPDAERCLRNIARLVKPGGYLFVSGIDLDVRTKVAKAMGWKPVTDLMKEIHEGDISLRHGWPLEYWGLESFSEDLPDWHIRYASVFRIGEPS